MNHFYTILEDTAEELASFLQSSLPQVSDAWWQNCVIAKLSYQQQQFETRPISKLHQLDLEALLKLLDSNWNDLAYHHHWPNDLRTLVREMQDVRIRWAHREVDVEPETLYRDLDTTQQMLMQLKLGVPVIDQIKKLKASLLTPNSKPSAVPGLSTRFALGEVVAPKTDPSAAGAVIQIVPGVPEHRYTVLQGTKRQSYYESQLQHLEAVMDERELILLPEFHAFLSSLQLVEPSVSSLYSLHAARVDFVPYQFRPVLKFIRSDRPRLLIADEVGVGKTIEAGLMMRELQARTEIESVLVICPKSLVTEKKWQRELRRFDEQFVHLNGDSLRYCIEETHADGKWPLQYRKAILPFSLLSERTLRGKGPRERGLENLDPPPHFDLVIIDEAHHLSNPETLAYQSARYLCDNAEAVVFLSATPVQLGEGDLYTLLNLLRPDLVLDRESFTRMSEPNAFITQASLIARAAGPGWESAALKELHKALATPWGQAVMANNPDVQGLVNALEHGSLNQEARVAFIREAENQHTFSRLINRTRRRDIGNFTVRKPETVAIGFTETQAQLHTLLLSTQEEILRRLHGDINLLFMMSTIRRQASSSIFGLAPFLRDILSRRLDELTLVEADERAADIPGTFNPDPIRAQIEQVIDAAASLDARDPKLDALKRVVLDKQALANNKCLLFTSFRHTLSYLYRNLQDMPLRVAMLHGATPDEERQELRRRFSLARSNPDALDLLLSSEVGCEGLDYQFCDCLLNYDLPWNPMRIEQRIGRIDRYGQQSETVAIYNFITPGTIDAEVYDRCLLRIGVFERAIGGSEAILGRVSREIRSVADNFALSEEERAAQLQQLGDNEIRIIQEQAALEEDESQLFGIRVPTAVRDKEVEDAENYWLSPQALQNLCELYLRHLLPGTQHRLGGDQGCLSALRLSQESRQRLLVELRQLPRDESLVRREWEEWLKGNDPVIKLTFDSACAAQNRSASFITPVHPLARQAGLAFSTRETAYVIGEIPAGDYEAGDYPFAIYQWKKLGVRDDVDIVGICEDSALQPRLVNLLSRASPPEHPYELPDPAVYDALDAEHYRLWTSEREEHVTYTQRLGSYRLESLRASHQARLSLIHDQLGKASDEKIKRMRTAQANNADAEYQSRVADLKRLSEAADIVFRPIAFGVLRVA